MKSTWPSTILSGLAGDGSREGRLSFWNEIGGWERCKDLFVRSLGPGKEPSSQARDRPASQSS